MRVVLIFSAILALAAAKPRDNRIAGGSVASIEQYPFSVSMLYNAETTLHRQCGGSILTQRAVLSVTHCYAYQSEPHMWRSRVGSVYANEGGTVHIISQIIIHPDYDCSTRDSDISILRLASNIVYVDDTVAPVAIAGANYNLADNTALWAIGWGASEVNGEFSVQLRHVEVRKVNRQVCRENYDTRGFRITDNMLCSGWLGVGGRDQCWGDSGSPLIHKNVVAGSAAIVGVYSWGLSCGDPFFPSVNTRVSNYTQWIRDNA